MKIPHNWRLNEIGNYDVDGDIRLTKDYIYDGKLQIRFGRVTGNFCCYKLELSTLEGCPAEVGGNFDCTQNKLTTLKGAPTTVGGSFYCSGNYLISLTGAPTEVGGNFECWGTRLLSLKGAPKQVGGNFDCASNKLTALKYAPKRVGGDFDCSSNQLTSLEGVPESIRGEFKCQANKLVVLKKVPRGATKINCYDNPLSTISIGILQFLTTSNRFSDLIKQIRYIDWAGVSGSIYSYEQWIPKSSRIEHINMTPQQARELKALQLSWV